MESILPAHGPRLLEVHEVAYQLKCSTETVRRFIREGKLPAVGLSARSWRVELDDLRAFIAARKTNSNGNGHRRDEAEAP